MNQLFYNLQPMEMYDENPKKSELVTCHMQFSHAINVFNKIL